MWVNRNNKDREYSDKLESIRVNALSNSRRHEQADKILVELLTELGYYETVDSYNNIYPKYYDYG